VELTGQSRDVFKLFWSAQQRFFKLLCISMKVYLLFNTEWLLDEQVTPSEMLASKVLV